MRPDVAVGGCVVLFVALSLVCSFDAVLADVTTPSSTGRWRVTTETATSGIAASGVAVLSTEYADLGDVLTVARNSSTVTDPHRGRGDIPDDVTSAGSRSACAATCVEPTSTVEQIKRLIDDDATSVVEYHLRFVDESASGSGRAATNGTLPWLPYMIGRWWRVRDRRSMTLQSLAFDYGIVSLGTLGVGVEMVDVGVVERPVGCFRNLTDADRSSVLLRLLLRDFEVDRQDAVIGDAGDARVCHKVIVNETGWAVFVDRCCFEDADGRIACLTYDRRSNPWLLLLQVSVLVARVAAYFFWPLAFVRTVLAMSRKSRCYVVNLNRPLIKTAVFTRADDDDHLRKYTLSRPASHFSTAASPSSSSRLRMPVPCRHLIDLTTADDDQFRILRRCAAPIQSGLPTRISVSCLDLMVDYRRLATEDNVQVGLWTGLSDAVLGCGLRHVHPFVRCCDADILRVCRRRTESAGSRSGKDGVDRTVRWTALRQTTGMTDRQPDPDASRRAVRCRGGAETTTLPWFRLCRWVGFILTVVVVLPFPFYVRLVVFYVFESEEVANHRSAADHYGLHQRPETSSPLTSLTPSHPLFVLVYLIYLTTAVAVALTSRTGIDVDDGVYRGPIHRVLCRSYAELGASSWTRIVETLVANVLWPFRRHGLAGCAIAVVYCPIVVPLTVVCATFCALPTVHLTVSLIRCGWRAARPRRRQRRRSGEASTAGRGPADPTGLQGVDGLEGAFDVERLTTRYGLCSAATSAASVDDDESIRDCSELEVMIDRVVQRRATAVVLETSELSTLARRTNYDDDSDDDDDDVPGAFVAVDVLMSALFVLCVHSISVVVSDCAGFVVEVFVYSLMGVIANADRLLKYVALLVVLGVHSRDCFAGVRRRYVELNRAAFAEVRRRIDADGSVVEAVTGRPFYLQANTGFLLGRHSSDDDDDVDVPCDEDDGKVVVASGAQWDVGGLLLFVDRNDTPRIPRRLFDEISDIRVAGGKATGPPHLAYLSACGHFLLLLIFVFFVFIVVLSFGEALRMSATNQTLATFAGGLLPIAVRAVRRRTRGGSGDGRRPGSNLVDFESVSFRGRLDEVIETFRQCWPMCDLEFEELPPPSRVEMTPERSGCSTPDAASRSDADDRTGRREDEGVGVVDYWIRLP